MSWQPRRVDLATVANLRELGGARAGTRHVRPGVLFRSTQLASVTDEDSERLQQLGISTVVDLRTSFEVREAPERRIGDYIWLDVLADSQMASQASMEPLFRDPKAFEDFLADGTAMAFMRQAYIEFVDLPSAQAAYARWLRDVASSEGGLLVHCTNGKDRTGWAVALALLSVGVHLDDVFTDYLTTNDQYLSALGAVFDQVAAQGVDPVLLEPVLGVREEYLQIALDRVADLGGLDAYLRLLQIDDQVREDLESRLLS